MANQSSKSSQTADKRKKLKRGLIGVSVTGLTFFFGWLAWKKFGPKRPETHYEKLDSYPELPQSSGGSSSSYRPDTNFPLSIYTKGEKVKVIQKALNARFNAGLKVDGYWGPTTEAALRNNGQPTSISAQQYQVLLDAVTNLGLKGPQSSAQFAMTLRSCRGILDNGQTITLNGRRLVGMVVDQGAEYADILTNWGRVVRISTKDIQIS